MTVMIPRKLMKCDFSKKRNETFIYLCLKKLKIVKLGNTSIGYKEREADIVQISLRIKVRQTETFIFKKIVL